MWCVPGQSDTACSFAHSNLRYMLMTRKMNYDRPVFKTQGVPPAHLTGEVCRSPSGECSAKRIAPDGNTCIGWEELLARPRTDTLPASEDVLCNGCRHHFVRGW